jgi:hypothetical protein
VAFERITAFHVPWPEPEHSQRPCFPARAALTTCRQSTWFRDNRQADLETHQTWSSCPAERERKRAKVTELKGWPMILLEGGGMGPQHKCQVYIGSTMQSCVVFSSLWHAVNDTHDRLHKSQRLTSMVQVRKQIQRGKAPSTAGHLSVCKRAAWLQARRAATSPTIKGRPELRFAELGACLKEPGKLWGSAQQRWKILLTAIHVNQCLSTSVPSPLRYGWLTVEF